MAEARPPGANSKPKARFGTSAGTAVFRSALFAALIALFLLIGGVLISGALYRPMWPRFFPTLFSESIAYSLKLTLMTTAATTGLAVLVGVPAAYALSRYRIPFSTLVDTVIDLPIVLPPLTAGVFLLIAFNTRVGNFIDSSVPGGLVFTPKAIILAQFFPTVTFCVRAIKGAFDAVDPRLESVARTLGCTEFGAFWRIVLPLARSGMLAGTVMTWARSVGVFGPIIMFCGASPKRTEVLSIAVFLRMSTGRVEEALCVALIMLVLALCVLYVFRRLGGRGYLW